MQRSSKVLFLYTIAFPYGNNEPYLNNELPILCQAFKKVVIVTSNSAGSHIDLPGNVEVVTINEMNDRVSKEKLFFRFIFFIASVMGREFVNAKSKSFFINRFRLTLSEFLVALIHAEKIKLLLKKETLPVIHYSFWMNEFPLCLSILKQKKIIEDYFFRVHGFDLYEERRENNYIPFRERNYKYSSGVFAISKMGLNYIKERFTYSEKASQSYLGTKDHGNNPFSDKKFTIVSCSNIIPLKRLDLLAKAILLLDFEMEWYHFGTGPEDEIEKISQFTSKYPSTIGVNFVGQVTQEQLFDFYKTTSVSVFINVSETEGLPVSIMEAISFGIPALGTDVGGNSEIVNSNTGWLLPSNITEEELANKIKEFKNSSLNTESFRSSAKDYWKEKFSAEKNYVDFCNKLLNINQSAQVISCKKCLLDSSVSETFTLNDEGVCNYCSYYERLDRELGSEEKRTKVLSNKVAQMIREGKGNKYDCILGVSGGVDSSYLAYWAHQNKLRPLVVHLDNGWNSELATENIKNICEKLGFELVTHVIDWEEFRELQLAYLRAGVVDIEVISDHAILATIFRMAAKYGIKYTLSGFNYATEAIMPKGWVFDKGDWENIKDIYSKFGNGKPIKTFPHISFYKKLYYHWFLKLESIQVLNYIDYNKTKAKEIISRELSWRDYGGKHYESVFTKFYQAYILPIRFGIDKRVAHLSNLICSEQITKEEAYEELNSPLYSKSDLENEKNYVVKKLGITESEFEQLLKDPIREHLSFKSEKKMWANYFKITKLLKFNFK